MLRDSRLPIVLHDDLVAVEFRRAEDNKPAGLIVQWNCHPETLDSKNTRLSADFVGPVVERLNRDHGGPVLYLTGTVGGLMTSLGVEVRSARGVALADGTFEKTERYGHLLADVAIRALRDARDRRPGHGAGDGHGRRAGHVRSLDGLARASGGPEQVPALRQPP